MSNATLIAKLIGLSKNFNIPTKMELWSILEQQIKALLRNELTFGNTQN